MKNHLTTIVTLGCALALFTTAAVSAETKPRKAAPTIQPPTMTLQKPTQRVESDLAAARAALKITSQQEKDWNAYADLRRHDAQEMEKRIAELQKNSAAGKTTRPLLDVLQDQRAHITEAGGRLDALIAATKTLYAILSPEQRTIADSALLPQRPPMIAAAQPAKK
jgi:hypothetical protein